MIHLDLPAGDSLTVKVEGSCHLMENKEEGRDRQEGRGRQRSRRRREREREREKVRQRKRFA